MSAPACWMNPGSEGESGPQVRVGRRQLPQSDGFCSPTAKPAMGSSAQNSSGAIRCSCNPRFRRRFRRVPESSRGFRCRKLMRFQRVPVKKADEVPEGSGAES